MVTIEMDSNIYNTYFRNRQVLVLRLKIIRVDDTCGADHIKTLNLQAYHGFEGRFFCIGMRFENNSRIIVIYVILTVYGENSITNSC